MSNVIKLKKGFNLNLAGKAEKKISQNPLPQTYAVKPTDFHDLLRPKVMVEAGDSVKAGTPILFDKLKEEIKIVSPVSGEVIEVKRGEKRKLLEIVILADKKIEFEKYREHSISDLPNLSREEVKNHMLASGVWPNIIQRPFGIIADPSETPRDIFISGFDSSPLAPDYDFLLKGQEKYVQAGIDILKKFTEGSIYIGLSNDEEVSQIFSKLRNVQICNFSGPHPAGNVGVQIHHVAPINKGDIVWTVNPFGLLQIGKLFLEGLYDASKIIALVGSEVANPQYYKTYIGGCIDTLIKNNIKTDEEVRYISGNVLTGTKISEKGYLGFYDHMVTVIPEGGKYDFLGWIRPIKDRVSFHRAFGLFSFLYPNHEYKLDTNTRGEERAFVQTGVFERVMPMDILPTHLLKAILAEDFDDMEALGIYEVIEEDMALCEFVDVSKHNIQEIIRDGINLIQYS
ncbi:MAG: Na(+)-translocating NADH-quinone reductase subunit A [Candidatus Cyclobacteriaceae bacterium M3_2C_046]